MEERLKALEGITLEEWEILRAVINESFEREKKKSTFTVTEDTLKDMKYINRLAQATVHE